MLTLLSLAKQKFSYFCKYQNKTQAYLPSINIVWNKAHQQVGFFYVLLQAPHPHYHCNMDSNIKVEFVIQELEKIGVSINNDQTRSIKKYLHFRTGHLMNDRTFDVDKGRFMDGKLTITHPDYERFLDIKKRPKSSQNVADWKKRTRGKLKSYPIHNRIIMGNYNQLGYNLLYGLTDEVAKGIKNELHNQTI